MFILYTPDEIDFLLAQHVLQLHDHLALQVEVKLKKYILNYLNSPRPPLPTVEYLKVHALSKTFANLSALQSYKKSCNFLLRNIDNSCPLQLN